MARHVRVIHATLWKKKKWAFVIYFVFRRFKNFNFPKDTLMFVTWACFLTFKIVHVILWTRVITLSDTLIRTILTYILSNIRPIPTKPKLWAAINKNNKIFALHQNIFVFYHLTQCRLRGGWASAAARGRTEFLSSRSFGEWEKVSQHLKTGGHWALDNEVTMFCWW